MILSVVFFLTYVAWAIIPDSVLISFGISYFPNKYWAVAFPLYFIMLGLFTVTGYIALSMYYNPELSDLRLAEDRFSKVRSLPWSPVLSFSSQSHATSARVALSKYEGSIPTPADIPLDQVCAVLYNKNRKHATVIKQCTYRRLFLTNFVYLSEPIGQDPQKPRKPWLRM